MRPTWWSTRTTAAFSDVSGLIGLGLTVHSVLLGFAGLNVHFFSLMQYCRRNIVQGAFAIIFPRKSSAAADATILDRKSTRLNSSHQIISYAVFCLKKKKKKKITKINKND